MSSAICFWLFFLAPISLILYYFSTILSLGLFSWVLTIYYYLSDFLSASYPVLFHFAADAIYWAVVVFIRKCFCEITCMTPKNRSIDMHVHATTLLLWSFSIFCHLFAVIIDKYLFSISVATSFIVFFHRYMHRTWHVGYITVYIPLHQIDIVSFFESPHLRVHMTRGTRQLLDDIIYRIYR